MIMSSKAIFNSVKYDEWGILADSLRQFPKLLRSTSRTWSKHTVHAYGVGSPRNCNVVVTVRYKGKAIRKVFRIDIRDGSAVDWLDKFDAAEWSAVEF